MKKFSNSSNPMEEFTLPEWPGRVFHYPVIPSTNIFLMEGLRDRQFKDYDVVWTDFQNAGRGRREKKWIAPNPKKTKEGKEGKALTFSISFPMRMDRENASLPQIAAWAWVSLMKESGFQVSLKWPNDILSGGKDRKKLAGLLAETMTVEKKTHMILGMGINLVLTSEFIGLMEKETGRSITALNHCLPSMVSPTASSDNKLLDTRNALISFLKKFYPLLNLWQEKGFAPFAESWKRESDLIGRRITLVDNEADERREVLVEDIDEQGRLVVSRGGRRETITFGEIEY